MIQDSAIQSLANSKFGNLRFSGKIWRFRIWQFKIWIFTCWQFKIWRLEIRQFKIGNSRFGIQDLHIRDLKIQDLATKPGLDIQSGFGNARSANSRFGNSTRLLQLQAQIASIVLTILLPAPAILQSSFHWIVSDGVVKGIGRNYDSVSRLGCK